MSKGHHLNKESRQKHAFLGFVHAIQNVLELGIELGLGLGLGLAFVL